VHTNDGSSSSRKEYAIPCGVSISRKIDLSVILDTISRRKSSFSSSRQGGVGREDTIGVGGSVGISTGVSADGVVNGALVGIGSRVGSVGPLIGGRLGCFRVGRGVIVGALGTTGAGCFVGIIFCVGASVGKLMAILIIDSKYRNRPGSSSVSDFPSTLSHRLSRYRLPMSFSFSLLSIIRFLVTRLFLLGSKERADLSNNDCTTSK